MRSRSKVKLLAVLTAMNLVFTIQPFAGEWRQDGDKCRYNTVEGPEEESSAEESKWVGENGCRIGILE